MEKRALVAVGLSVLVLLAYQYFFIPRTPQQLQPQTVNSPVANISNVNATVAAPSAIQNTSAAVTPTTTAAARAITVKTDRYTAVFSTRGATMTAMSLVKFKDDSGGPINILQGGSPALGIGSREDFSLSDQPFECDGPDAITLGPGHETATLACRFSDGSRSVQRTYTFKQDSYLIAIHDDVRGLPEYEISLGAALGINQFDKSLHTGPVALIDTDRKEFKPEKISTTETLTGPLKWVALEDKYFFSALVPSSAMNGARVWKGRDAAGDIGIFNSQGTGVYDFTLYAGPKELDNLKALNIGIEHIVDFGFFSIIARPIFWMLNRINDLVHNYGWSIILLTILIRIPFIPIVNKGQESMRRLQELQPKMAEIKEKFAKDPARMQQETMEMYKKHKVNPMGGCLPMLLQIPVFFALYKVLLVSIELRGAPFALWIHDLATKDPYYVLPVVMGVSMLVQQKMTPTTGDSTQQKVMMLMPIIFTFMFLNFASGLVLYWLVNNLLSISQQLYVMKKKKAAA